MSNRDGCGGMALTVRQAIQNACDDVYGDPDDSAALQQLRQLLSGPGSDGAGVVGSVVPRATWRRLIRIACDELHDDPDDQDAKDRLLLLLVAGDGGSRPKALARPTAS